MACRCKYFVKIFDKCCCCVSLRTGTLIIGCMFLTWFVFMAFGAGFMMQCIFPNEYQREEYGAPAAMKTTMVFSAFGIISAAMVCIGVHYNNELMFVPFLTLAPIYIFVHILAMIIYAFIFSLIMVFLITIFSLIYAWLIVWSYYTELRFAYEEDLHQPSYI